MATAHATATVPATPERVWELLTAPERFGEWMAAHTGFVGSPPSALAAGTAFGQNLSVLGMPAAVQWTVTQASAPHRLVMSGDGPMGIAIEAVSEVTEAEGGSDVALTYTFEGGAVFAVAGQLEREVGQALQTSLASLATLVPS